MLRSLYRKPHFLLPLLENPMNCIHVFPTFENPAKLPTPAQGIYSTSASSLLISVLKIWGHLWASTPIPKHPGCWLFTVAGHENLGWVSVLIRQANATLANLKTISAQTQWRLIIYPHKQPRMVPGQQDSEGPVIFSTFFLTGPLWEKVWRIPGGRCLWARPTWGTHSIYSQSFG